MDTIVGRHISVLIPFYTENEDVFVFLQRRSDDAPRLPGFFGFWGGGVEEGETPEEALKREIREELDILLVPSDYAFFGRHVDSDTLNIFTMPVKKEFSESVRVLEGEYGRWLSQKEVGAEKISDNDRAILDRFFVKIKNDR